MHNLLQRKKKVTKKGPTQVPRTQVVCPICGKKGHKMTKSKKCSDNPYNQDHEAWLQLKQVLMQAPVPKTTSASVIDPDLTAATTVDLASRVPERRKENSPQDDDVEDLAHYDEIPLQDNADSIAGLYDDTDTFYYDEEGNVTYAEDRLL